MCYTDAKEPSKMATDEKPPIAEKGPEQDAPLTKEEFTTSLQRLIERARAAGLHPIHTMAKTYAKQGMTILEGLLASLENANSEKKKP